MAENNQWLNWLKCNVLEIVILVLVLVLLVKVFSAPVAEAPTVTEIVTEQTPQLLPAVPTESTSVENVSVEQPSDGNTDNSTTEQIPEE